MNKMMLTVGATLTAFAAATAGTLPTEYGDPAEDIASGSVEGLTWTGAARAYKIANDTVLVFTNTAEGACSFTVAQGKSAKANCLLVGGGGGGGQCYTEYWTALVGAGGGAGGMLEQSGQVFQTGSYAVNVGKGGAANSSLGKSAENGGDSFVSSHGEDSLRASGGGRGGFVCGDFEKSSGANGGSGGGAAFLQREGGSLPGQGVEGQGSAGGGVLQLVGGYSAGGGGAGAAGCVPNYELYLGGAGGNGRVSRITGEEIWYAGGGAGGSAWWTGDSEKRADGGKGGGGASIVAEGNVIVSENGVNTLGGGGAGAGAGFFDGYKGTIAGRGGNGVVVIRITEIGEGEGPLDGVKFSGEAEWYNIGTGKTRETVIVYTNVNEAGSLTLSGGATARFLLVGGGGAGGRGGDEKQVGGGGGAGGMVTNAITGTQLSKGTYTITVGAGGVPSTDSAVKSGNGQDSVVRLGQVDIFRAVGGGAGGNPAQTAELAKGTDGGSGGGGAVYNDNGFIGQAGGNGKPNQGNGGAAANTPEQGGKYANAGGGGGAGSVGHPPIDTDPEWRGGAGGDGLPCDIIGVETWYAGGGAGGTRGWYEDKAVSGGKGGGGMSATKGTGTAVSESGVDGLGGGGAGMSASGALTSMTGPGRGGNGVVVIRITKVASRGMTLFIR